MKQFTCSPGFGQASGGQRCPFAGDWRSEEEQVWEQLGGSVILVMSGSVLHLLGSVISCFLARCMKSRSGAGFTGIKCGYCQCRCNFKAGDCEIRRNEDKEKVSEA